MILKGSDNTGRTFARNLRFLRKAAGLSAHGRTLSQGDLAGALGISRRSIISWESGNLPQQRNIELAGDYFSKKLGVIITAEDLINKDLTGNLEFLPVTSFERELTPSQRGILNSLFLSARQLSEDQLMEVLDFIADIQEGEAEEE